MKALWMVKLYARLESIEGDGFIGRKSVHTGGKLTGNIKQANPIFRYVLDSVDAVFCLIVFARSPNRIF